MLRPLFARSYVWFPTGKMGGGLADQTRPVASEEEWGRVDSLYRDVSTDLEFSVYLLLTAEPAELASVDLYVHLEPLANLALAVDRERGQASICADWWLWRVFEAEFRGLQEHVGANVRAGRTIDALVEGLDRLRALLGGTWQITHSYDRCERAVITQGTRRWEVTRG
jgi:hypothetical protein